MKKQQKTLLDKCYKDSDGKVVLAQSPNLPIIVWLVCTIVVKIIPTGKPSDLLQLIAFGSLFTWAWLELFQGTTYLRRLLGFVVIAAVLYSRM